MIKLLALLLGATSGQTLNFGALELCDPAGWCSTPLSWTPTSVAGAHKVFAFVDKHRRMAVWSDGAWRAVALVPEGHGVVEVRPVADAADAADIITCGKGCLRWRLSAGVLQDGQPLDGMVRRADPWSEAVQEGVAAGVDWRLKHRKLRIREPGAKTWRSLGGAHSAVGDEQQLWLNQIGRVRRLLPGGAIQRHEVYNALLRRGGCPVFSYLVGPATAPVLSCGHHGTNALHRFDGASFSVQHSPWRGTWARVAAAVHSGAGCDPCLLSESIVWRDSSGWHQAPRPPDSRAGGPGDRSREYPVSMTGARIDARGLSVRDPAGTWSWSGEEWEPASSKGDWSSKLDGFSVDGAMHFSLDDGLLRHGYDHRSDEIATKKWDRFGNATAPRSWMAVRGVRRDDVLKLRRGPHHATPEVGTLAPDAVCVSVLGTDSSLGAGRWRQIARPSEPADWVKNRYLKPMRSGECVVE